MELNKKAAKIIIWLVIISQCTLLLGHSLVRKFDNDEIESIHVVLGLPRVVLDRREAGAGEHRTYA